LCMEVQKTKCGHPLHWPVQKEACTMAWVGELYGTMDTSGCIIMAGGKGSELISGDA